MQVISEVSLNLQKVKRILNYSMATLWVLCLPGLVHSQNSPDCRKLIGRMVSSIDKINTLTYSLVQTERIGGELNTSSQDVKLSVNPFKLYIYNHAPNKGAEVLWVKGANNGNALVNPNSFPYVNVNLDPYGSILRNNQHHTIFESGFEYLKGIIQFALDTAGADFNKYFRCEGLVNYDGKICYKVIIEYDRYAYVPYTVKKGENLITIAKKQKLSEYMIESVNDEIDDYYDVHEGQVIKVPVFYAKKSILYLDKSNSLPIKQEMYDEKGLYERYEFHNLKVNPQIFPDEFTENYKDYHF